MSNIQYQYYPKSNEIPIQLQKAISVFKYNEPLIGSTSNTLQSNEVLHILSNDINGLGYRVEKSKRSSDKIRVPVLFGRNGSLEKYFEADCYNETEKIVIEIEAGRAVTNYQFLKDIFQACVMHNVEYLVIAVRNTYRINKDFETVLNFLDTLYASNRLTLPLKGILIIGY
ncbi:MAG: hypothetical protein IKU92_02860 [Rikenellaceae bacterium]|nr:hypothetical protein [Rikenellaceae bacterium]